jgi:hypothetical protein
VMKPKKKTGDRTENEISSRANYQEQTRRCFLLTSPHLESDFTRSKLEISNRAVQDRCCFCLHLSRNTTSERGDTTPLGAAAGGDGECTEPEAGLTSRPREEAAAAAGGEAEKEDGLEVGKEEEG